MQLPSDSIGISDILDYRECPQRFAFKMQRHVPLPERFALFPGEKAEAPEAMNENNAYGSCFHDAVALVEKDAVSDEEAVRRVWPSYQHWLEPEDLELLKSDLEVYHQRTHTGYRLVAAERDMKVPLFVYKGRQIYFRFKVDALYQHMQNEGIFLLRDYKSTKYPKTEAEWLKDLQQWAYNWAVHEYYPEIERLIQEVDQLRAGVIPLQKTEVQRRQIKAWLIQQVTAMLDDDTLRPFQNEWCHFCPIMMDCRVTHLSADYWKRRLAAAAPEKKKGNKILVELTDGDQDFELYTGMMEKMSVSSKVMKRFDETVKAALKAMPASRRTELGYRIKTKSAKRFTIDAKRRIFDRIGRDEFLHLASLTQTALESFYGKGKAAEGTPLAEILAEAEEGKGAVMVQKIES